MKFGKTFNGHQIPEWAIYYMNYKSLKKIIKSLDQVVQFENEDNKTIIKSIISSFFFELDRDIEKVDNFYNTKFKEYNRRFEKACLVIGYQDGKMSHQIESNEELEELISIMMELRSFYRNLKWYGELNHKGIIKILKKLDKKLGHVGETLELGQEISTSNRENYLKTRVEALPFSNGLDIKNGLDSINAILNILGNDETTDSLNHKLDFLKVGDRKRYSFDHEFLELYYNIISKDDAENLIAALENTPETRVTLKFLLSLLNKAALSNSRKSIDALLSYLDEFKLKKGINNPLFDETDLSGKSFFHHHILSLGKNALTLSKVEPGQGLDIKRFLGNENGPDGIQLKEFTTDGLEYILSKIEDKHILLLKDNYLRTPLHYSGQYGLKDASRIILSNLKNASLLQRPIDDLIEWGDREGLTPLHLAIIGKHPKTTENLVKYCDIGLSNSNLMLLAVRFNCIDILSTLLNGGLDLNYTDADHNNETALYIASKLNFSESVKFLLEKGADTELGENVFGWTPIFIAASEGFRGIVNLLIEYGCNHDIVDDSGWLPMEHASLRGHLEIADLLIPKDPNLLLYDAYHPEKNLLRNLLASPALVAHDDSLSASSIDKLPEPSKFSVNEVYKNFRKNGSTSSITRSKSPRRQRAKPVKSFGHRYLSQDESLILITLGTTDLRDEKPPIELNKISLSKSFLTELDTALSVLITCREKSTGIAVEPPVEVDLPLEDYHGSSTDPITFKLSNSLKTENVIITFDIVPTYQFTNNKKDKVFARAVALLDSTYTNVGPNLRSLNTCVTLPFIETNSLDILGSVRFEYLYVESFDHPQMKITRSDTYWKQLVSTRVIGHRGLGKNINGRKSLQIGENTVESFIAAASLGASYVEFDVQLTKDFVPVVYHDFTVAESGVDIPMHAITAEQFLSLNNSLGKINRNFSFDDEALKRPRSMSTFIRQDLSGPRNEADKELDDFKNELHDRMKFSKTWKQNGFKGNSRGFSVASNFVTLKELFKKLPNNVGFNIELKYPMLDEAEQESMGEIAIDMNFYVDTILKVVYDENTSGRDILFSSFHPDICLLLSLKQPTMPILFLTEAGTAEMADIRASSLQNAIRFAKKWNLLGIVSAAQTLVKTPRLTQVVKSSGLVCVTYGTLNNETELATIQMKAGVDAVIVDNVLAVREGLRKHEDHFKDDSSNSE